MNLRQKIVTSGIDKCMFLVPMQPIRSVAGLISYTTSSDPEVIVPAKIAEERYKLSDNYKITLAAIYPTFGQQHFYLTDLEQLIKDGTVEFYTEA